jgi:hypothetical protein
VPITTQKSPVFSIVSLPTDSVIVDHAVLECKKVSSRTSKGRNIYYMDRYQRKTISKLKNLLHDSKIISRNFRS